MIKAKATGDDGKHVIVLGLSKENITRLNNGATDSRDRRERRRAGDRRDSAVRGRHRAGHGGHVARARPDHRGHHHPPRLTR